MRDWRKIFLYTVIFVNGLIGALIFCRTGVTVDTSVPAMAVRNKPIPNEYVMELTRTTKTPDQNGFWIVEHYQEMEYQFNDKGRITAKIPTPKQENIRYWKENLPN